MHKINLCYFLAYKTSVFVRQNSTISSFSSHDSWAILSPIEQQIKDKIERIGTPLRDWDIRINYGIKTGLNEAFIITAEQRIVLLEQDPRSAEILRPILRGRDIKRYMYEYQDLWLIATFPSLKINIDLYPAVKQYLVKIGLNRLQQNGEPGARKRTNNKWFETQDSISYWEDFSKQKIVWGNLNLSAAYTLAEEGVYVNAPCPMIVPANKYILAVLNSKLADYYIRNLGVTRNGGYFEYKPMFVEQLPIPHIEITDEEIFSIQVSKILGNKKEGLPTKDLEEKLDIMVLEKYQLTPDEVDFILSKRGNDV